MFHYRWAREEDQKVVSRRLAEEMTATGQPGKSDEAETQALADMVRERMSGRGFAVGSNPKTAGFLESSFRQALILLERHFQERDFLFGSAPAFADFGLAPQLYQALVDPTAGGIMKATSPKVCAWCERMLDPCAPGGRFESWASLAGTLEPFLSSQVTSLWGSYYGHSKRDHIVIY